MAPRSGLGAVMVVVGALMVVAAPGEGALKSAESILMPQILCGWFSPTTKVQFPPSPGYTP